MITVLDPDFAVFNRVLIWRFHSLHKPSHAKMRHSDRPSAARYSGILILIHSLGMLYSRTLSAHCRPSGTDFGCALPALKVPSTRIFNH